MAIQKASSGESKGRGGSTLEGGVREVTSCGSRVRVRRITSNAAIPTTTTLASRRWLVQLSRSTTPFCDSEQFRTSTVNSRHTFQLEGIEFFHKIPSEKVCETTRDEPKRRLMDRSHPGASPTGESCVERSGCRFGMQR